MSHKIIYFLIVGFLISCNDKNPSKLEIQLSTFESIKVETMEVHDEVMPKMGELMELSMKIDSVMESPNINEDEKQKLIAAQSSLNQANSNMMEWMRSYSKQFPYEGPQPNTVEEAYEQTAILKEFQKEIEELQVETQTALENAHQIQQINSWYTSFLNLISNSVAYCLLKVSLSQ